MGPTTAYLTTVYILAIPVFSFFLPLYSFWRMDDFTWGSTRLGAYMTSHRLIPSGRRKGQKDSHTRECCVPCRGSPQDEGKFDPRSIPLKAWNEYE